jgi:hypothetical protein
MRQYLLHILIALDQLGTTLLGGFPDETMSSYAYRMDQQGKPYGKIFRPFIDWLFSWDINEHCKAAYLEERERLQMPPELRT